MVNSKISPNNCLILLLLLILAVLLGFFNYSDIDIFLQNHFFDFEKKTWMVDKHEVVTKFIFYQLPKFSLGCLIVFCLAASILGFKKKSDFFHSNRHHFLLTLLGYILIPLIAGNIKKFTNIYCPYQLEIYDGNYPYVKILEKYPADFVQLRRGKCFPAGHAITGFSLFILFFSLKKKSHKIFAGLTALTLGWILGFYQITKGAHFLSDTVITMLVCFLLAAIIDGIYKKMGPGAKSARPQNSIKKTS
jgi:membrane-associated PAP2 superfamily phosphatase